MSWFKNWPTLTEFFFGTQEKKKPVKKAAPKVKAEKKLTKKELSKLTKVQLEELGRQKAGIELDRRLTKAKLVAQLHKAL